MSARTDDIRAAVERARQILPDLPSDYADQAIASGRNLDQVKGDLVDRMSARSPREQSKANMLKQVASMAGTGKSMPDSDAGRSRASMERELRAQDIAPALSQPSIG